MQVAPQGGFIVRMECYSDRGKAKRRRLRRKKESQPRLAALGSPFQGKGLAWPLPSSYGRRENAAFPILSFRAKARNLFRLRSGKRCEERGSRETPRSLQRGMPIRERTVSHSFSSRGGSEPPPLRTASFRGKEGVCRLPPHAPFPHLNTRTGWRPVRAVFLESSEWSSHKTIGL